MINYIILGLISAVLVLSVITVAAEYFVPKNTGAGRLLRGVRIRLREKSFTGLCVFAAVVFIIALVWGDDEKPKLFAGLGIMLLSLIILHPWGLLSLFRQRKKAKKSKRLPLTPKLAGRVPEAGLAKVLEPVDSEDSEEGKE
jgi:hypothetical protein